MEVKIERPPSGLPDGEVTAGVRRGAMTVTKVDGKQVNVWSGVLFPAGQFIIGGVPFLTAFSTSKGGQPLFIHVIVL